MAELQGMVASKLSWVRRAMIVGAMMVAGGLVAVGITLYSAFGGSLLPSFRTSQIEEKPTPNLVVAVRDLARLETLELQIEKVVDLKDQQTAFFGLIDTRDSLLMVASGSATLGVDLGDLRDGDVRFDADTGTASFRLPAPEVFRASLDEKNTYVFKRDTGTLAKRNENLESDARRRAVGAIEKAAHDPDVMRRARVQAERELRALAMQLGAKRVVFEWKDESPSSRESKVDPKVKRIAAQ